MHISYYYVSKMSIYIKILWKYATIYIIYDSDLESISLY